LLPTKVRQNKQKINQATLTKKRECYYFCSFCFVFLWIPRRNDALFAFWILIFNLFCFFFFKKKKENKKTRSRFSVAKKWELEWNNEEKLDLTHSGEFIFFSLAFSFFFKVLFAWFSSEIELKKEKKAKKKIHLQRMWIKMCAVFSFWETKQQKF